MSECVNINMKFNKWLYGYMICGNKANMGLIYQKGLIAILIETSVSMNYLWLTVTEA